MAIKIDIEEMTLRGREVWFGKYKGFFMLQAIHRNPQWFEWCIVNIDSFKPYPDEVSYFKYRSLIERVWHTLGGRFDPFNDPNAGRSKWNKIDIWLEERFGGLPTEEDILSLLDVSKRAYIIRDLSRQFSILFGDESG